MIEQKLYILPSNAEMEKNTKQLEKAILFSKKIGKERIYQNKRLYDLVKCVG